MLLQNGTGRLSTGSGHTPVSSAISQYPLGHHWRSVFSWVVCTLKQSSVLGAGSCQGRGRKQIIMQLFFLLYTSAKQLWSDFCVNCPTTTTSKVPGRSRDCFFLIELLLNFSAILSKQTASLPPWSSLQSHSYQMPEKVKDKFPLTFMGSFITLSMLSSPCLCFSVYPITFHKKQGGAVNIDHHSSFSHTDWLLSLSLSSYSCQSLLLPWFRYCISFSFYYPTAVQ